MYGIAAPLVWTLEKLGRSERFFAALRKGQLRRLAASKIPSPAMFRSSHDVFIATFAKSGTNWVMQIVHQLLFHGQGEFDHIHDVVPWPDMNSAGPMRRYAIPLDDPSVWMASPEHRRVIKTHFDWDLIPYSEDARYIAVIRDPKDVFVSSYFFFVKSGILRAFDAFERPLVPAVPLGPASRWAAPGQRTPPATGPSAIVLTSLVLSFKQMKRDLRGTVLQVAEFLNLHLPDTVLDEVFRKSSFEYMKQINQKFAALENGALGSSGLHDAQGRAGRFFRIAHPAAPARIGRLLYGGIETAGLGFSRTKSSAT